ncbi:MAG: hypothetical protein ACF8Q5_02575 [Phycisphaerales bacterium JB040]
MPTIPTSEAVLRARYAFVFGARALALFALAWGVWRAAGVLIESRVYGPPAALVRAGFATPEPVGERLVLACVPVAVALLLALVAPRLARLLLPLPRPGCPFCRYPSLPETGSRCPECGHELPAQLLARQTD